MDLLFLEWVEFLFDDLVLEIPTFDRHGNADIFFDLVIAGIRNDSHINPIFITEVPVLQMAHDSVDSTYDSGWLLFHENSASSFLDFLDQFFLEELIVNNFSNRFTFDFAECSIWIYCVTMISPDYELLYIWIATVDFVFDFSFSPIEI